MIHDSGYMRQNTGWAKSGLPLINILKGFIFCMVCTGLIGMFGFSIIAKAEDREVVDRIMAVVNDDIIILSELNQSFKPYAERIRASGYPPEKEREMRFTVREDILNQLIDKKLSDQEIKRSEIIISDEEIDSTIERIKESTFHTDEELREALAREGLTIEEYRKQLKEQLLRTKLVNYEIKSRIVITKEDIKSYYENHKDEYKGEKKYHLWNIIMRVPLLADEAGKLEIENRMEAILTKLKEGQPFETMVRNYSESSSTVWGGDLGLFQPDELSPQIQDALKMLKQGEFTSVLDTDQGYQIFYISEIVMTPGKTLDEVSSEIEEKFFQEKVDKKFNSWLADLRKRSHIKIIK